MYPFLSKSITSVFLALFLIFSADQSATALSSGSESSSGIELSEGDPSEAAPRVYFKDFRKYPIHRRDAAVPEELKALDGKEIQVVGYMVPFDRIENITQFILLQAPFMGCMHVPPPGANETLMIKTERPLRSYTYDPIRITGKLSIDEVRVDGYLISVYTIDATDIRSSSSSDAELDDLPDNFHFYGDM